MASIKKTKSYWLYIVLGIVVILLGVLFAPFWAKIWSDCPWKDWGSKIVSIFMAVLLFVYLFAFLLKKMLHSRGTIQVLTIIEFVILCLIAIGLVFSQFKLLNIPDDPSKILGLALYCRGVIEIFRAYYHQRDSKAKYPIWWLVIAIIFVSLGVYLMVTNVVTKIMVVWVFAICLFVIGLFLIVYGALSAPAKKGSSSSKSNKEAK